MFDIEPDPEEDRLAWQAWRYCFQPDELHDYPENDYENDYEEDDDGNGLSTSP